MKTAYCYFSASNNTLDIAKRIEARISGDIYYIPKIDVNKLKEYDRIIILSPIYSFGIALPVENFIKRLGFLSDKEFVVVMSYAGFAANSKAHVSRLFEEQKLNLVNVYLVQMPVSFSTVLVPPKALQNALFKKLPKRIDYIISSINKKESKRYENNVFSFLDEVREKNMKAISLMAKDFSVSESCVKCEKCIQLCPMDNISFVEGEISFGDSCCGCLGCYNNCPKKAIVYRNKPVKTYLNSNL